MCPRSSDPFFVVIYYIKWSLLLGHTVGKFRNNLEKDLIRIFKENQRILFIGTVENMEKKVFAETLSSIIFSILLCRVEIKIVALNLDV